MILVLLSDFLQSKFHRKLFAVKLFPSSCTNDFVVALLSTLFFSNRLLPSGFLISGFSVRNFYTRPLACRGLIRLIVFFCQSFCHTFFLHQTFSPILFLSYISVVWFSIVRFFSSDFLLLEITPLELHLRPLVSFVVWLFVTRILLNRFSLSIALHRQTFC